MKTLKTEKKINNFCQKNQKKYNLLIFDWDGTLMNSIAHIIESVEDVAKEFNIGMPSLAAIREATGLPTSKFISYLFPDANFGEQHQQLVVSYVRNYQKKSDHEKLFKGAKETLYALQKQGYKLAIATNKERGCLRYSLEQNKIHDLFSVTRCGDDEFTKPQPEVILDILSETMVPKEAALMIGDTEYDMQTAINAEIDALAVGYGLRSKEQLLSYAPVACIDDIRELVELLVLNTKPAPR